MTFCSVINSYYRKYFTVSLYFKAADCTSTKLSNVLNLKIGCRNNITHVHTGFKNYVACCFAFTYRTRFDVGMGPCAQVHTHCTRVFMCLMFCAVCLCVRAYPLHTMLGVMTHNEPLHGLTRIAIMFDLIVMQPIGTCNLKVTASSSAQTRIKYLKFIGLLRLCIQNIE